MDRPFTFPGSGRKDINGIEWWACDPYPTWYRRDHEGMLITPKKNPEWAADVNDESEIKNSIAAIKALTDQGLAGFDEIISTLKSNPAMQESLPADWLDRCEKARETFAGVQKELNAE